MTEKAKNLATRKNLYIGGGVAVFLCVFIVGYVLVSQPVRSVEAFCKAALEHKPAFKSGASYQDRLKAFSALDQTAPEEIRDETERVKKGYEQIVADASKTINVEFGIAGSTMKISDYIDKNCPSF